MNNHKHIIPILLLAATVASGQTSEVFQATNVCSLAREMDAMVASIDAKLDALIKSRDYWRDEALKGDERCKQWMALYESCRERDSDTMQRYTELFVKYANLLNEPPTVTQSCQRTHCDTPADTCAKNGHQWAYGCGMIGCLATHGGQAKHCAVCGKIESQPSTPAPMPWPWRWGTNGIITVPMLTSHWYNNAPNTWPGTYSTNYVTNINANVEAP